MKRFANIYSRLLHPLFWLLLIFIPFGKRKLLFFFTPSFHEYESAFIYISDCLLLLVLLLVLWHSRAHVMATLRRPLVFFLLYAAITLLWAFNPGLAIYDTIRLYGVALMYILAIVLITDEKKMNTALAIIAASAVFQSLVGIGQAVLQRSIDSKLLYFLGQSHLEIGAPGAARIMTADGKFLRAYGTLPHANIYAAFLCIGLIALMHFWTRRPNIRKFWGSWEHLRTDLFLGVSIFMVLAGLVLSFSRSGWISAAFGILIFFACALISRAPAFEAIRLAIVLIVSTLLLYNALSFGITPRINNTTTADYSISARLTYNQLALKLIKDKLMGVGLGNQVLYSYKYGYYQAAGMAREWEWQPIHNLYLLIATEIGIIGLAAFLFFVGHLLLRHVRLHNIRNNPYLKTTLAMVGILLIFGMSDHFLWDLQPGRLMLWLSFGLLAASTQLARKQESS